ncbi:MAG: DNA-processing protein DprA [Alphaproteobacteria bacterium]|nr:DNA-processing protein DprA [Alphaproteobacteria bacterium]
MLAFHSKDQILSDAERLAWLRLVRTENVGPITFYQLIARFGTATKALEALPELSRRGGRAKPLRAAAEGDVYKEYERLAKLGGKIVVAADEDYPLALGALDDAPPVLSVIGDTRLFNRSSVAIVGARNASINGRKFASSLARDLGGRGQVVVSGLARGIDTAAHEGALHTGTIAVVAGGVDVIYPEENAALYAKICEDGAVVAESALGQKPFAAAFPRRNRIVSGLSKGVVVVEATQRSGSMITARLAGEQGRDVFAVPGSPLDPRAAGPNHLIREGATLVRGADDILEALMNFSGTGYRTDTPAQGYLAFEDSVVGAGFSEETLADVGEMVLGQLSYAPVGVDEIIRALGMPTASILGALLELELAGRIKRLPGGRVVLESTSPDAF